MHFSPKSQGYAPVLTAKSASVRLPEGSPLLPCPNLSRIFSRASLGFFGVEAPAPCLPMNPRSLETSFPSQSLQLGYANLHSRMPKSSRHQRSNTPGGRTDGGDGSSVSP
jgi:hypothetical protein